MAKSGITDPLLKYRWTVSIPGFIRVGFTTFQPPKHQITPKHHKGLGQHLNPKSIVDSVIYQPIILTRGRTDDQSFTRWAQGPWDLVQNNAGIKNSSLTSVSGVIGALSDNGAEVVPSDTVYPFSYRRDVKIEHCNRAGQVVVVYTFYNAYPIEYIPTDDFDSSDDNSVSIESLTLDYEGYDVRYTGVAGLVGNVATGLLKR